MPRNCDRRFGLFQTAGLEPRGFSPCGTSCLDAGRAETAGCARLQNSRFDQEVRRRSRGEVRTATPKGVDLDFGVVTVLNAPRGEAGRGAQARLAAHAL